MQIKLIVVVVVALIIEHLYICAKLNDSGHLLAFTVKQNILLEVA